MEAVEAGSKGGAGGKEKQGRKEGRSKEVRKEG